MCPDSPPSVRSPRLPAGYRGARDPLRKPLGDPLWIPVISHYRAPGRPDTERMAAQLRALRPNLSQVMLAGSTGDGWELDDAAYEAVVGLACRPDALDGGCSVLFGVLSPTTEQVLERLALVERIARSMPAAGAPVLGVAACPPIEPQASQRRILDHFERIVAASSLPVALYQLPQVTGCAIAPETMREMARWPRVVMFKDSSGADAVATAGGLDPAVVLLRGAEGGYAEAVRPAGPYDGWLLSTANSFPGSLRRLAQGLAAGKAEAAREVSAALTGASARLFAAAAPLAFGNAFSNANRAGDHILAWGARWDAVAAPRTISGALLPRALLAVAVEVVAAMGEMPERGYLAA